MKTISLFFFVLILCFSVPSFAEPTYTCKCMGLVLPSGEKIRTCGNGATGGNYFMVYKKIPGNELRYFMSPSPAEALRNTGQEQYCNDTGWMCKAE